MHPPALPAVRQISEEDACIAVWPPLPRAVHPKSPAFRAELPSHRRPVTSSSPSRTSPRPRSNTAPYDRPYACITAPMGTYERHIYQFITPGTCLGYNCAASSSASAPASPSPPSTSSSSRTPAPKTPAFSTRSEHPHPSASSPPSSSSSRSSKTSNNKSPESQPQTHPRFSPATASNNKDSDTTKPPQSPTRPSSLYHPNYQEKQHDDHHHHHCCADPESGPSPWATTYAPQPSPRRCFSIAIALCVIVFSTAVTLALVWTLAVEK